jgi:hypothetical protein
MDKEKLDQLIEIANKQEPLDLTHVEEARFVRDLDVPAVVLLWRSSHGEVRHWFAKYPAELTIASDGGITTSATAFWVVQPEGGFTHQGGAAGRLCPRRATGRGDSDANVCAIAHVAPN